MGLKLVLPGVVFTDPNLPKLYPDPIMSKGSLVLLDFAHSAGWDGDYATPPASDQRAPNIAWEQAAAILGGGSSYDLAAIYRQAILSGSQSSKHKVEFSGKKGVHCIVSQNPGLASGENLRFSLPSLVKDYIKNHLPDTTPAGEVQHDFYFSMWYKLTRPFGSGTAAQMILGANSGNYAVNAVSTDIFGRYNGAGTTSGVTKRNSYTNGNNGLGSNIIKNTVFNSFAGEKASGDLFDIWWGRAGAWNGFMATNSASYILYRVYVEDLTVSGRTYAELDALDYAMWQAAFAEGGRFYNDTYTDPATLP